MSATYERASTMHPSILNHDDRRAPGSLEWLEVLEELRALHLKKTNDYGSSTSAFANVEASTLCGVEPWRRALCDASDCIVRMQQFAVGSKDVDTDNALIDLANWAIICLVQLRREQGKA